jgi:tRNA pseudouridine38-40 synthase
MTNFEQVSDTAGNESFSGRIALCLSYNGFIYHGWQSQKSGLPTVQKFLEHAISKVANHPVKVICAGRTDSSVHATHQVVHFETTAFRNKRAWVFGCNANLPKDISVSWAGRASEDFHARFSAISRRYHYVIYNHPIRPAIFSNELTLCHAPLNAQAMHKAAQSLVGKHDFSSYRAAGCQANSPVRTLEFVNVKRYSNVIVIDIKGNAFLLHMVRNIAGVLMSIGKGEKPVSWCADVLALRDRKEAAVTASPSGLYLTHVDYPLVYGIPQSTGAPSVIQAMLSLATGENSIDENMWDIATKS